MSYHALGVAKWSILALEEVLISKFQNSRELTFQLQNSMTDVSVTLRPPYLCPLQSSIRLGACE